ncbi:MAG: metal-sensitive transcriptional regulator [Acidobacteria bacterium]|nr:metal-sensitive transcriptional regulator [Acidobacteriota bacterium]
MAYLYGQSREQLLARLRRVEGQVRGVQRMIEEDKYCVDVLTQIQAAAAGLEKVGLHMLSDHIRGCVRDAVGTESAEAKIAELVGVVERFMKAKPSSTGL